MATATLGGNASNREICAQVQGFRYLQVGHVQQGAAASVICLPHLHQARLHTLIPSSILDRQFLDVIPTARHEEHVQLFPLCLHYIQRNMPESFQS